MIHWFFNSISLTDQLQQGFAVVKKKNSTCFLVNKKMLKKKAFTGEGLTKAFGTFFKLGSDL